MIVDEGGKYKVIRTPEEEEDLLLRELQSLNAEELETLKIMLAELGLQAPPGPTIMDVIGNAQYERTPVDIETFIRDPYFLGETCDNMYPVLLEDLTKIFKGGYNEVIITGAIGYGKSFIASVGVCRVVYELSCMKNPQRAFGLASDSKISAICLSVNENLAIKVAFEYVATKMKASEYFEKHFPFKPLKKELVFPKNVWVAARATTDTSALGLAPICAFLDETNFLAKPTKSVRNHPGLPKYDQAETLYNAIKRRMKSRFKKRGRLPGVMFLVSSKQTVADFTERKIRESKGDPQAYVMDYSLWEVKPDAYDMENTFPVFCGNELAPSQILEPSEADKIREDLPEGTRLIDVPIDFRPDFERDLEGSIRDIAGVATAALHPYMQRREKILEAVDKNRAHPFSSYVYDMSKGGSFLWDKMVRVYADRQPGGEMRPITKPIINPNAVRHVHIDPAITGDCAGFCMAHVCGWKDVVRRNDEGREYMERAPVYFVDVILQIKPPLGGEIILGEIRRLVYELSTHGYVITSVTQDSYQSYDGIQKLSQKGYNANLLSVDTSIEPYDNLKLAYYENRINVYEYEPLNAELRSLEKNTARNKVDHPPNGSKDCSDCLAGVCFTLSQSHQNMPLPIVPTSGMNSMLWVDPGYAASNGGTSPLIPTPPSPGLAQVLPPFIIGGSGSDWGSGWNPGSL